MSHHLKIAYLNFGIGSIFSRHALNLKLAQMAIPNVVDFYHQCLCQEECGQEVAYNGISP
jgi:hypothetical protein